jgi:thioredoxin:protein disulfide reductase
MKRWLSVFMVLFVTIHAHAEPLPASEAFHLQVRKLTPNTFALEWAIRSGYFLYSNRIQLAPQPKSNVTLGALRLPPTEMKTDKQGHVYTIYRTQLTIPVDVLGTTPGESVLDLDYQGCADDGFCYPPEKKQIQVGIDAELALTSVRIEQYPPQEGAKDSTPSSQNEISNIFLNHNWFMILMIFFGLGLLLAFTPCILPMVPVLSGIIVGHGKTVTTKKAFFLSLSYVLSMSLTYAVVGAVVALLGENLQVNMQSPWVISIFSSIFIGLALSMFGFYEFKLPEAWQAKIAGSSRSQRGGHYIGAAIMGCLSTLILSPCVTAPLIGVLTYIAQSHNVLLGSLTLFVLSLGMGTPLLLIGTSAGKLLPQAGSWMNAVKAFFGIILVGIAIYLMSRILPAHLTLFLWACLFIFSGIFSGALTAAHTHKEKMKQGLGIILFVYGLALLIGSSMGADDPLRPLPLIKTYAANEPDASPPIQQTVSSVKQLIHAAKGTPVLLDFYADWCASCKVIEATTFKDPQIKALLAQIKLIKIDVTKNNTYDKELMHYFKVIAPPTFLFFDKEGQPLNRLKTVGEVPTAEFIKSLQNTLLD